MIKTNLCVCVFFCLFVCLNLGLFALEPPPRVPEVIPDARRVKESIIAVQIGRWWAQIWHQQELLHFFFPLCSFPLFGRRDWYINWHVLHLHVMSNHSKYEPRINCSLKSIYSPQIRVSEISTFETSSLQNLPSCPNTVPTCYRLVTVYKLWLVTCLESLPSWCTPGSPSSSFPGGSLSLTLPPQGLSPVGSDALYTGLP